MAEPLIDQHDRNLEQRIHGLTDDQVAELVEQHVRPAIKPDRLSVLDKILASAVARLRRSQGGPLA